MSSAVSDPDHVTEAPVAAPRSRPPASTLVVVAAVVVVTLALAWYWRWTTDDAFINFRVARSILEGSGPVFNAGERVEVGTSPLWLWLLTGFAAILPADISWIAVTVGAVGSATGLALACLGADALHRPQPTPRSGRGSIPVPAGALVFLSLPATWTFLTSGLETGLTFAWLGAVWFGTARQAVATAPTRPWWLLVVLGLAPLIRPDLAIAGALLGAWLLIAVPSSWPRRIRDVAVAGALPVAYQVFRMGYYGLLVPNTAVAKESSRSVWDRGWTYLADLVAPYALYVPVVVCAGLLVLAAHSSQWNRRVLGLVAVTVFAAVCQALFVVRVGGDFMHGRLLLPALFLLLCPVALVPVTLPGALRGHLARWTAVVLVPGLLAWAAVCVTSLRVDYAGGIGPRGIADERGLYVAQSGTPHPVTLAEHGRGRPAAWGAQVDRSARAGADEVFTQQDFTNAGDIPTLVPLGTADGTYFLVYQAGYLGYAVSREATVLDFHGLSDPIGSHLEPQGLGRPGHEKILPIVWFWARHSDDAPELQTADPLLGTVTPAGLEAARAALACGDLAEYVAATSAPMSWTRFWANLTGSVERTSLRIPADPEEAEARFC